MRRMGTKNCLELGLVKNMRRTDAKNSQNWISKKHKEDGYEKQFGTEISKKNVRRTDT